MKKIIMLLFLIIFSFKSYSSIDNNSVTITTIGNGTTFEKSRQSALLSAITQVCGVYMSQDIKIINDELVKDEITSITKGNIEKYSILSEVKIENGDCVSTLNVTVSIFKLKSYMEAKGYKVVFNGASFAMNINLKTLNEEAEIKAITSMTYYLEKIADNSFDFEISASDPISVKGNNMWKIPLTVYSKPNINFKNIPEYMINTLNGISLTEDEKDSYLTLQKEVFVINIQKTKKSCNPNYHTFYLRNQQSVDILNKFIFSFDKYLTNFFINDGINKKKLKEYKDLDIYDNFRVVATFKDGQNLKSASVFFDKPFYFIKKKTGLIDNSKGYFPGLVTKLQDNSTWINLNGLVFQFNNLVNNNYSTKFTFYDVKSLEEIKSIKEYSINHIPKESEKNHRN
jgi:hypothetical protein